MKVLILPSEQFIPLHEPLAGTFQSDQAKILINAGFDVAVISVQLKFSLLMLIKAIALRCIGIKLPNETGNKKQIELIHLLYRKLFKQDSFIFKEQLNGVSVYRAEGFYVRPPSDKTDFNYWIKAGLYAFKKYLYENGKPDIIHAHNALYGGMLAAAIYNKYNIPYMLTEHSSYYSRKLYHKTLLAHAKRVFENARIATAVSYSLIEDLKQLFPSTVKWELLPNVADPIFERKPLEEKIGQDSFVFLHIANLIPLKRQELLIEAFHNAFEKKEAVVLEFAGEGESFQKLKQMVTLLDEQHRIFFLGRLSKEKVFEKLNEIQVVCLPSMYETFGVSLLEANLRGVPVLATKCGGPNDIVSNENGLLIEVDDTNSLQQALKSIRQQYSSYSAELIRIRAIEKYGSKAFLRKLNNYYNQLLN